jgi:hypothetical protein
MTAFRSASARTPTGQPGVQALRRDFAIALGITGLAAEDAWRDALLSTDNCTRLFAHAASGLDADGDGVVVTRIPRQTRPDPARHRSLVAVGRWLGRMTRHAR